MHAMCTVSAKPHPFQMERVYSEVRHGQTLTQMLGDAVAYSARVQIGGHDVPRALWDKVRPKAGQMIHVDVFPQGGDGNKWIRAVLMVALIYFTAGAGATWASGISAATGISTGAIYAIAGVLGSLEGRPLLPEMAA